MTLFILEIVSIFLFWPIYKLGIKIGDRTINGENIYILLIFIEFFLTMSLRAPSVGTDTKTYRLIYESIMGSDTFKLALKRSTINSAPVYVGIQYIISRITHFEQLSTIVNSLVICTGFFIFIKNNSKNKLMSIFLFVGLTMYFESMNGTRQFMAISIAINAYELIKEDIKSLKGWGLFLIALGIHNTISFFLLAFIGIMLKKSIEKNIDRAVAFSILLALSVSIGFSTLMQIAIKLFPYFSIYLNGENAAQINISDSEGRIVILYIFLLILIFICIRLLKNNKKDLDYLDLFTCLLCSIMGIIFSKNFLVTRLLWPFICIYIVFLPSLFEQLERKISYLMYMLTYLVILIYCVLSLVENKSGLIPYVIFK